MKQDSRQAGVKARNKANLPAPEGWCRPFDKTADGCYAKQSQSEASQDDHRQASLDAATRQEMSDCVKQSQFAWRTNGGHSLSYGTPNGAWRAKQSQWAGGQTNTNCCPEKAL